eukprot:741780-Rhodomonas_salina.2
MHRHSDTSCSAGTNIASNPRLMQEAARFCGRCLRSFCPRSRILVANLAEPVLFFYSTGCKRTSSSEECQKGQ